MPNSRPRISFDPAGVCNACRNAEDKQHTDWAQRRRLWDALLDKYRRSDGGWDCLVPWSGGKDSSAIAYKLKFEFGMNPLLVTASPMLPNEVGRRNREALLRHGFDHVFVQPNVQAMRTLAKRFFIERGNPKIALEASKEAVPVKAALDHGISLIIHAEHGESEYGGKVLHERSTKERDYTEVVENIVGDDAANWVDERVTQNDINMLVYPSPDRVRQAGIIVNYFSYYFKWSMYENYMFIRDKISFQTCPHGRTIGTFTDFDSLDDKMDDLFYYLQYVKFGFGRAVRDGSRLIQTGHMTREQALDLARKYDGEFPSRFLDEVLDYLDMTMEEFTETIDRHRNSEIWDRRDGRWTLRFPLPEA
jgi:N-acetyl sugar amidotransferase